MRPTARLYRALALGLSLTLGCTADPEDFVHEDDAEEGDSQYGVSEAAAAPGVRVPTSLALTRSGTFYLTLSLIHISEPTRPY